MTDDDGAAGAARTPTRKPRRKALLIGGAVLVAALAAVGITAGALIHQEQQRAEYAAVVDEVNEQRTEAAELQLGTDLASVLSVKELAEAKGVADRLKQLGETADPIFTAEQAKALKTAGESVAEKLPKDAMSEEDQALADQATKALKSAGVKVSQWTGTDTVVLGDVVTWEAADVERVKVGEYSPERLEAAKQELKVAEQATAAAQAELDDVEDRRGIVADAVAGALESVRDASANAPKQVAAVTAVTQSVPDTHAAVTSAAKAAADTAKITEISPDALILTASTSTKKPVEISDAALVTMLSVKLKAYADAGTAAKAAETEAVAQAAAAEAAAAAAAAGTGGYVDPGTGGWVDTGWAGGGGGWVDTGWTGGGGGGGYVPPAGGGGTAPPAGGGGGYDPGYVPGGGGCLPPPPGWYPTGGSGNGCPTYAPPGSGGEDEW
ncbi:hypothetical protein [Leucobacter sp. GX0328]